jgi:hypothetical protein
MARPAHAGSHYETHRIRAGACFRGPTGVGWGQITLGGVTGRAARRRSWRWAVIPVLALVLAACTSSAVRSGQPPRSSAPSGPPATASTAQQRFTVLLSTPARELASSAGVSLSQLLASALNHINALLPGPPTVIVVKIGDPSQLIPRQGVSGFTSPATGQIILQVGRTAQSSLAQTLHLWLLRDLAHEVNHSVRILGGTGFGATLLQQTISEGIATAFDQAAFPGPPDPWTHAITPAQECTLWRKAESQVGATNLYNLWMFGGPRVPHWTAFTIGYHIVNDYRDHHRTVSWAQLTAAGAPAILAASHYQPCPPPGSG